MLKTKHTPGPWKVESDGRGPYVVADGEPCRVCTIEGKSFKTNGGVQDWADARLVAKAPELLQALWEAHNVMYQFTDYTREDNEFRTRIERLLREAGHSGP